MDYKNILSQIYDVLSTIDTHGESTLKMAECLNALYQIIVDMEKRTTTGEEKENKASD